MHDSDSDSVELSPEAAKLIKVIGDTTSIEDGMISLSYANYFITCPWYYPIIQYYRNGLALFQHLNTARVLFAITTIVVSGNITKTFETFCMWLREF